MLCMTAFILFSEAKDCFIQNIGGIHLLCYSSPPPNLTRRAVSTPELITETSHIYNQRGCAWQPHRLAGAVVKARETLASSVSERLRERERERNAVVEW